MSQNKNYQIKKLTIHSSCLIHNPQSKLEQVKFQTFYSSETTKNDHAKKLKLGFKVGTNLSKQLNVIESMRSRSWLKESKWSQANNKYMPDLLVLIKKQKAGEPGWKRCHIKKINKKVNHSCSKHEDSIRMITSTMLDVYTAKQGQLTQRSNNHEFSDQPTRVKLFKKLSNFNRNETLDNLSQYRASPLSRNRGLLGETFQKNRNKLDSFTKDSDQGIFSPKQSKYQLSEQQIKKLEKIHSICRKQSMLCKGEIIVKDDQVSRRKRCIRKMSIIDKEIQIGRKQPVFLLQI